MAKAKFIFAAIIAGVFGGEALTFRHACLKLADSPNSCHYRNLPTRQLELEWTILLEFHYLVEKNLGEAPRPDMINDATWYVA
jgi:hypothetical protein